MRTREVSLSAGVWREEHVPKSAFFMLLSTVAAIDVEIFEQPGGDGELAEGVESGYRVKQGSGEPIRYIKFYSATDQTIKFGYSNRDADNRKVTSTVAVVDGSVERSKNGNAFYAVGRQAPVAGQYPHVQLWNPAGSGVVLIVNAALAYQEGGTSAESIFWGQPGQLSTVDPTYGGGSKLYGASPGAMSAEVRIQSNASQLITTSLRRRLTKRVEYQVDEFQMEEPFVIEPGYGLAVSCNVVNRELVAMMQFYEEPE